MEEKSSISKVKRVTGSYKFRVEGYSALSSKVGDSIESPEFTLCGFNWQLRIFPGGKLLSRLSYQPLSDYFDSTSGSLETHKGNVSFYLASKSTRTARASYKLMILSQVAGGIDECFTSSGIRVFEPKGVQVDGWGRDKFVTVPFLMDHRNGLFVDDSVIFKVEICVVGELENKSDGVFVQFAPQTLESNLKYILETESHTDIILEIGETKLKAHKSILCARSPVFAAMLSLNMFECQSGVIEITDTDTTVMKELLYFMYTDQLSSPTILKDQSESLFCAASKYQIMGLVTICEDQICHDVNLENILSILCLSDTYGSSRIKEKAFQLITQNYTLFQKQNLVGLDKSLMDEIQFAIDMSMRRQGCFGNSESEKRFNGSCAMM